MKKLLLLSFFTVAFVNISKAQSNLQFNAVRFLNFHCTVTTLAVSNSHDSTIVVPTGKVWKIERAFGSIGIVDSSTGNLYGSGAIYLNYGILSGPNYLGPL